jgi:hypothetical protein
MVTPLDILEPGGTLIVASECSEGFGSKEFQETNARLVAMGPKAFLESVLPKPFADIDEWQTEMQLKPRRLGKVQLYTTGMTAGERAITGVEIIESIDEAIVRSIKASGDKAIAIIPEGPYVVPFCTGKPS